MKKTLEIIAVVIVIAVVVFSALTMPWPVSVTIGVLLAISSATVFIHSRIFKSKEQDKEQSEKQEKREYPDIDA